MLGEELYHTIDKLFNFNHLSIVLLNLNLLKFSGSGDGIDDANGKKNYPNISLLG